MNKFIKSFIALCVFAGWYAMAGIAQAHESQAGSTPAPAANTTTKEADDVKAMCYKKLAWRNRFDCECVASKFETTRQERGPQTGKDTILSTIMNTNVCLNYTAIQSETYKNCIGGPTRPRNLNGIEPEAFCQCAGNKYVETLAASTRRLGPKTESGLKFSARMHCMRPSSYQ